MNRDIKSGIKKGLSPETKEQIKTYAVGIGIPLAVGGLSALLTAGNMDIYDSIQQPPLAPPAALFPIAWTILYVLMGIGSVWVYKNDRNIRLRNNALLVYLVQLAVNFFWSIIFFNFQAFLFSFIWLVLLWGLIILMIYKFSKVSKPAAYLQIPYLLWVTFAGYLNFAIYILN